MLYEEPRMEVLVFGTKELPYTDLIDTSVGSGPDYGHEKESRSLSF